MAGDRQPSPPQKICEEFGLNGMDHIVIIMGTLVGRSVTFLISIWFGYLIVNAFSAFTMLFF